MLMLLLILQTFMTDCKRIEKKLNMPYSFDITMDCRNQLLLISKTLL